jgi:signal transduction histidine kinase
MPRSVNNTVSRASLFRGWALIMALSLLSVIGLLIWWQKLLSHNMAVQYGFIESQIKGKSQATEDFYRFVQAQDEKLADQIFIHAETIKIQSGALLLADQRLKNRQRMVLYEQVFFILLLLSGHLFFLYVYIRERILRKQIEETVLLATHELRQPLQSLSLALETIQPGAKGRTLKAIEAGLAEIAKLSQHIRFLADTFSNASVPRYFQVADMKKFVTELMQHEFNSSQRQRIQHRISPHPSFRLPVGEASLRFILRNLTENALKYGSGKISFAVTHQPNRMLIDVVSNGNPISASEFRQLGDIFKRSKTATVQNTPGFGLGLYLCGRIVRRAAGKLQLTQSPNGKVTAHLELKIS